jgi:hypothetical protein
MIPPKLNTTTATTQMIVKGMKSQSSKESSYKNDKWNEIKKDTNNPPKWICEWEHKELNAGMKE